MPQANNGEELQGQMRRFMVGCTPPMPGTPTDGTLTLPRTAWRPQGCSLPLPDLLAPSGWPMLVYRWASSIHNGLWVRCAGKAASIFDSYLAMCAKHRTANEGRLAAHLSPTLHAWNLYMRALLGCVPTTG